jgi:hypothetical protein
MKPDNRLLGSVTAIAFSIAATASFAQGTTSQTPTTPDRRDAAPSSAGSSSGAAPAATAPSQSGQSSTAPGRTGATPGQSAQTPGQSDSQPPGQAQTTPGQSATTPGQAQRPSTSDPARTQQGQSGSSSPAGAAQSGTTSAQPGSSGGSATGQSSTSSSSGSSASQSGSATSQSGSTPPRAGGQTGQTASVTLDAQQRTRISEAIFRDSNLARTSGDVSVTVGATLPRRVTVRELPDSILAIVPQYRGYRYVVVRDEIVIVEPRTRRVVTVIERSAGSTARARVELSPQQRQMVRRAVMQNRGAAASTRITASIGQPLPSSVTATELPATVVSEVPTLREYRYVVSEDNVYLVSPRDNEIVAVIED